MKCSRIRAGNAFDELRHLLARLGFDERIRGDHHIYTKDGIEEILNLQPRGTKAKPYQVKQVRAVIVRYKLPTQTAYREALLDPDLVIALPELIEFKPQIDISSLCPDFSVQNVKLDHAQIKGTSLVIYADVYCNFDSLVEGTQLDQQRLEKKYGYAGPVKNNSSTWFRPTIRNNIIQLVLIIFKKLQRWHSINNKEENELNLKFAKQ